MKEFIKRHPIAGTSTFWLGANAALGYVFKKVYDHKKEALQQYYYNVPCRTLMHIWKSDCTKCNYININKLGEEETSFRSLHIRFTYLYYVSVLAITVISACLYKMLTAKGKENQHEPPQVN